MICCQAALVFMTEQLCSSDANGAGSEMPCAAVSSWLKLLGFSPPATRTPISAAKFAELTKNVVFRTPQRQIQSPCIGGGPHVNSAVNITIACRVRWYNQEQGWGYASPQQIYRPDVRISAAVIHEAGLNSVAPGDMFMVTFDSTRTRPNAIMLRLMLANSFQHSFLDLLDEFCLSKIFEFVGDSLPSMAMFCLAYRPAFLLEKEFHYGHILLGCVPNCVPPLRWFEQRITRISSITSAHFPQSFPSSLQHHPIQIQSTGYRNEDYRSIKNWSSKLINSRTGEEIASCKGWALEGKGWLNHMEGEHMELCHIGQSLVEVARPAAADNFTSLWGSNWYMMNSGEGISHLLREPLLAERLGLPPDFSLQATLVFEDISVKPAYHGSCFGLLMLKTIIGNFFEEIRHESPSYSRHGLVFCVTHPPQFSGIGSFEFHENICVEEVTKQIEHWNKGMLCDGKLYSRKFGKISTDRSIAGLKLNEHFGRLGFRSLSGPNRPPLQIGAHVELHDLELSKMNGAFGVVHEALDSSQRLAVKIMGPQRVLELFSAPQDGKKRFSGCLRVRPENCTEQRPKFQNILFLNPDVMLNPFGGNLDSMYFESMDSPYDHHDFLPCLYDSDLESGTGSSDDED